MIPVRVAVRIRPLSRKEISDGCDESLDKPLAGRPQIVLRNCDDKAFTYDYVYDPKTEQRDVFKESVSPLVDQLFKGMRYKNRLFEINVKKAEIYDVFYQQCYSV